MTQSTVYGTAFEVGRYYPEGDRYRIYRHAGRSFMGHDSTDIFHTCSSACTTEMLSKDGYVPTTNHPEDAYVDPTSLRYRGSPVLIGSRVDINTADVGSFDPGDDPYVLCATCQTEILRDDSKFEDMFGHKIGERL